MTTKTCWQCRSEVHMHANVCPQCRSKLGSIKANGMASRPLGCWAWGAIITGGLFLLGAIPGALMTHAIEAKQEEERKVAQEETARLKALPPSEHLKWARTELDKIKKTWSNPAYVEMTQRLGYIPSDAPERREADQIIKESAVLEAKAIKAQAKAEAEASAQAEKALEPQRKAYAHTLENELLDKRMNADVTTSGPRNTVITIKWALVSKVTARDIEKNGRLHQTLRDLHFKKLIITDGYRESWYWTY